MIKKRLVLKILYFKEGIDLPIYTMVHKFKLVYTKN